MVNCFELTRIALNDVDFIPKDSHYSISSSSISKSQHTKQSTAKIVAVARLVNVKVAQCAKYAYATKATSGR